MKIFQKGFNYSQDGDGNRLVWHLQGCNMTCPWCANPEGMPPEGVLLAEREWLLESICPHGAIREQSVNRSLCAACEKRECVTAHRTKGMRLSYTEESVETLLREAEANRMLFYDGGGVTFTGGEATLQFEELFEALAGLKERGIHTALETNGAHPHLPKLFPLVDQMIIDCKQCICEMHRNYTGLPNDRILANIRQAAKEHPKLHVRVPLIGGVNDSEADREAFLHFFREIRGENVTFEVLAYHEFGRPKWQVCGREYQMTKRAYVDEAVLDSFRQEICRAGCKYQRT